MFPGVAVHPAGTKMCSKCGRPIADLRSMHGDGEGKVPVGANGDIAKFGVLLLRQQTDPNLPAELQAQIAKREAAVFYPLQAKGERSAMTMPPEQRRQLRHGQVNAHVTTQSVYSCAFEGCGNTMHADEMQPSILPINEPVRDEAFRSLHNMPLQSSTSYVLKSQQFL